MTRRFKTPKKNAKIWRYLDLSKFISLISEEALTFTRVDVLNDSFEGSYSKPSLDARDNIYSDIPHEKKKDLSNIYKRLRAFTFINCWHISEYESEAMWRLYLSSSEGIAIQSTYNRLNKSFNEPNNMNVVLGNVNYIDYTNENMDLSNPLLAFFYKRKSFEYENELRAAFTKIPMAEGGFINLCDFDDDIGKDFDIKKPLDNKIMKLKVDLNILIEKIYVSPTSEDWFMDIIKSIVGKYDLNKEVKKSDIINDPIF